MAIFVFDLESNGLYSETTKLHCIVNKDIITGEVFKYPPDKIREGLEQLYYADMIIGHNIAGFDVPLIQRFYSKWVPPVMYDTLIMCRLLNPERHNHTLDSYGKQFNRYKPVQEDWSIFTPEILHRCSEDVEINHLLYDYLIDKEGGWDWTEARLMEQEIALIHLHQTVAGVTIDVPHTNNIINGIDDTLFDIDSELNEKIPMHYVSAYNTPINKPFKKDQSFTMNVKKWFEGVR